MLTITNDKLDCAQEKTQNMGAPFNPANRRFLIAHYTAGTQITRTINHFKNPSSQASAHLVIDRDGSITQIVPFSRVAWHAGISAWKPSSGKTVKGLNAYSIGIELVNAGWLRRSENGIFFTWRGEKVDPGDVIETYPKAPESFGKRWWMIYPEKQLSAFIEVAEALVDEYSLEDLLGHSDISPGRKTDPGPVFPIESIRSILFGRA